MNGNKELIEALNQIEKEKDISKDILIKAIKDSILAACKNQFERSENIEVNVDSETGAVDVFAKKTIVEEVIDKNMEISLAEAEQKFPKKKLAIGDVVNIVVTPKDFMRISAQKAKQAVVQKIREEGRKVIYNQFISREHDVVTGIVQRANETNIPINLGRTDAILPKNEQIATEHFKNNDRIKVYVLLNLQQDLMAT